MKLLKKAYWAVILAFLYMPIFVMIAFSFNQSKSRTVWTGFTLKWYVELFKNEAIIKAFITTLFVAVIAATVATILGTIAAVGIDAMKAWEKSLVINISYMPVVNPDIIKYGFSVFGEDCKLINGICCIKRNIVHSSAVYNDFSFTC